MKPKPGDRVKIFTKEESYEGTLLPRPEILEGDVVVLKLDTGYNIGIENNRIEKMELLEEFKPIEKEKLVLKNNPKLPTVSILSAGGTISSRIDYKTGGVYADYAAEDFVAMCPELQDIANIKAKKVMSVMSEDMNYQDWLQIAKAVKEELDSGVDGVVVTQGTDTLHFTSAALSFLLKNLSKPVILTASQRSIDRGSSDAFMNLICAVKAAAKFDGATVATCLHANMDDEYCYLNRGTKVRKMHTSRRDAFRPMGEKALAKVPVKGEIEVINNDYVKRVDEDGKSGDVGGGVEVDDKFEPQTALVLIHPGVDPEIIDFYLSKGYKGIVLAATALGHIPTVNKRYSFMDVLERAKEKGVPVVIASQTLYGGVHPYVYTNLRKLSIEKDCIFVGDMLPETAFVKLCWVLGHTKDKEEVKKLMQQNIAGEISTRVDAESFLY